ncbi:hypothetical protein, conserved [Eimeria tenella]|uniref:ISP1 C-terminal domain-containing protein n=1 Tax=Eimeria tenella TaxID=5802 RepID=U6LBZ2_EIMTE|nr:hypothetical protein, conserved [Eimeria tenella]CDJ45275.1 hypothetical protein, conserved [Eimeria tenella]|eukprot:XP_013236022.1 hypothetical protein, conserved [Eimeria tenella]
MGNACSGCCGDSSDPLQVPLEALSGSEQQLAQHFRPEMAEALKEGLAVGLILQDKSRLECVVRLSSSEDSLLLSCEAKSRVVPLQSIKALLHSSSQLLRVDCSAGIRPSDFCAALHLAASGNCIPLFFASLRDKNLFLITLAHVRTRSSSSSSSSSSSGGGGGGGGGAGAGGAGKQEDAAAAAAAAAAARAADAADAANAAAAAAAQPSTGKASRT